MAVTSTSSSMPSMAHNSQLRGYSDFFASGFRAVSTRVKRRPTSLYSTTSDSSDTEDDAPAQPQPPTTFSIFRSRQQRRQRRPVSMLVSSPTSRSVDETADRRMSLSSFSSKLFERMPFSAADENVPTTGPFSPLPRSRKTSKRRRLLNVLRSSTPDDRTRDSWLSTGSPSTPSAPNGQSFVSVDPFASSPESKSFFIDLSDSSSDGPISRKRESFLSMATTTNSSQSISLIHYSPRRERPVSMQTIPLSTRSRRSSFHCRGQSYSEKLESSWIHEEEDADFLNLDDDFNEARDDAAQIDWRQFHNDLLTVDEA